MIEKQRREPDLEKQKRLEEQRINERISQAAQTPDTKPATAKQGSRFWLWVLAIVAVAGGAALAAGSGGGGGGSSGNTGNTGNNGGTGSATVSW